MQLKQKGFEGGVGGGVQTVAEEPAHKLIIKETLTHLSVVGHSSAAAGKPI